MTTGDILLGSLAAAQIVAMIALAIAGLGLAKRAQQLKQASDPSVAAGKRLAARGQRVSGRARAEFERDRATVTALFDALKQRWSTTRSIAGEIVPHYRKARAESNQAVAGAARRARRLGDTLQRLGNIRRGAEAARRASENGRSDG